MKQPSNWDPWKSIPEIGGSLWAPSTPMIFKVDLADLFASFAREELLPRKLTCPLKINAWKMYFLLKYLFRGHSFVLEGVIWNI